MSYNTGLFDGIRIITDKYPDGFDLGLIGGVVTRENSSIELAPKMTLKRVHIPGRLGTYHPYAGDYFTNESDRVIEPSDVLLQISLSTRELPGSCPVTNPTIDNLHDFLSALLINNLKPYWITFVDLPDFYFHVNYQSQQDLSFWPNDCLVQYTLRRSDPYVYGPIVSGSGDYTSPLSRGGFVFPKLAWSGPIPQGTLLLGDSAHACRIELYSPLQAGETLTVDSMDMTSKITDVNSPSYVWNTCSMYFPPTFSPSTRFYLYQSTGSLVYSWRELYLYPTALVGNAAELTGRGGSVYL